MSTRSTPAKPGKLGFADYLAANSEAASSRSWPTSRKKGSISRPSPFCAARIARRSSARKLGQLFFNAKLTTSLSLGHQKSRRKDERIMLAALTRQRGLCPLARCPGQPPSLPLAGVYSLPLLAPLLLRKLGITASLPVADHSGPEPPAELPGKRRTAFQPPDAAAQQQYWRHRADLLERSAKLQQYLVSQRLIGRKQPINGLPPGACQRRKALESSCVDSDNLSFTILDIEDCAQQCSFKTLPPDTRCEPLFLQLLAADPPRAQFASDAQRHDYHLWLVRSVLQGTGAIALFGCLLWSGRQLYEAYQLNQEVEVITAETSLARRRYEDILKTFPPIPTSNESLRRVINRYVELENASTSPAYLWREISRALHDAPSIELDGIEWKAGGTQPPRAPLGVEAQRNEPPGVEREIAVVHGTLRLGAESNPRQVLAAFKGLVDALELNPQLEVEVLQQPFDVESGKPLKGGDATVADSQPRAFKVQIRRTRGS
jgi:hypothetical protein